MPANLDYISISTTFDVLHNSLALQPEKRCALPGVLLWIFPDRKISLDTVPANSCCLKFTVFFPVNRTNLWGLN